MASPRHSPSRPLPSSTSFRTGSLSQRSQADIPTAVLNVMTPQSPIPGPRFTYLWPAIIGPCPSSPSLLPPATVAPLSTGQAQAHHVLQLQGTQNKLSESPNGLRLRVKAQTPSPKKASQNLPKISTAHPFPTFQSGGEP